jgi:hypothetical protein
MNESKLDIFIAKMKVAASNGSSGPENTTSSGKDPMMQRWLYFTKEQLAEQDERIIRLCKYPDMIPDELLVAYADVLLASLGQMRMRRGGRLGRFIDSKLRKSILTIADRLADNGGEAYPTEAQIRHEMGLNPDGTKINLNDGS